MELEYGRVVLSVAGKDKGQFLAVTKTENDRVYVCNGKERPIERVKAKNLKHVKPTKTVLTLEQMSTNKQLRKSLRNTVDA